MASAHESGEVTWAEVPGGRLAVEVNSQDTEPVLGARATAELIAEAREVS